MLRFINPLFFILFLLLHINPVAAHAVITDTSLKIDPIKAGRASQVSLAFNARVELKLSLFKLIKKGDIQEPLRARAGDKRGEVIVDLPVLEPGEHALKLKVFAVDGHLTEDIIRFVVIQ